MGCGVSVEAEVVNEDPFQALLVEIVKARADLQQKIGQVQYSSNLHRYVQSTVFKEKAVLNYVTQKLNEEYHEMKELEYHIALQDAIDVYESAKGFGTNEKMMASVVIGRRPESILITDEVYRAKYGKTLESVIRGENLSLVGILTGGLSDFGKFLSYRVMPMPKLLALVINKCMKGVGCSDQDLCEILSTNTNANLKAAAVYYKKEYNEDMVGRIRSETDGMLKRNYGAWVRALTEFNRDETSAVPPQSTLDQWAKELYQAGAAKMVGCDEEVFLRILVNANEPTLAALVEAYSSVNQGRSLIEDIDKKMDGDLQFAVQARVRPRYEFLAQRIHDACKGIGTDEDDICRILGCNDNAQCLMLRDTYDEIMQNKKHPYNSFKSLMESELSGDLLDAIMILLKTQPPKNHWRDDKSYTKRAIDDGREFEGQVKASFNPQIASAEGGTPLNGPLTFIGVRGHPFLLQGCNFRIPPSGPIWQNLLDMNHLFKHQPSDINDGQQLLNTIKTTSAYQQQLINLYNSSTEALLPTYYSQSFSVRATDHHASELTQDNDALIEFCCQRDADVIREATKGWGTDDDTLIRVICSLSKSELRRVNIIYKEKYGKTLKEILDEEVDGFFGSDAHFKYFMNCLLSTSQDLDAAFLQDSMKGWGTDDKLLTEIVCTRTNGELIAAKEVFQKRTGESLESWIKGDTSGLYQRFLLKCLAATRNEGQKDAKLADSQAEQLHKSGLNGDMFGKNEEVLLDILSSASSEQIVLINTAYKAKYGDSLYDAIKSAMSLDIENAMLIRATNKYDYYAGALSKAWEGFGTDEQATSRILGRLSKQEIRKIEESYNRQFGKSMRSGIEAETTGNYKKALLAYLYADKPGWEEPGNISGY